MGPPGLNTAVARGKQEGGRDLVVTQLPLETQCGYAPLKEAITGILYIHSTVCWGEFFWHVTPWQKPFCRSKQSTHLHWVVGDLTFSGIPCRLAQEQILPLQCPSTWRLAAKKYFHVGNFWAHPSGACSGQKGGWDLQASFKWFHYIYATEMSRDFWPRNSGAKEVFKMLWVQHSFRQKVSIAASHHQQLPASPEHQPLLPHPLCLAPSQSCAGNLAVGWCPSRKHPFKGPLPKRPGECNLMVSETEAIGNLVSVPDLAREVIPTHFFFAVNYRPLWGPWI